MFTITNKNLIPSILFLLDWTVPLIHFHNIFPRIISTMWAGKKKCKDDMPRISTNSTKSIPLHLRGWQYKFQGVGLKQDKHVRRAINVTHHSLGTYSEYEKCYIGWLPINRLPSLAADTSFLQ